MINDRETIRGWKGFPVFAVIFTVAVKTLFLLTHHIQEDAFITWRVAQNLMDYGVIGFNGDSKISASTTHLYVFVSYFFNLIFGKEYFIYPLLIFNSLLFTIGSYFLSKLLLKSYTAQAIFIFLLGILPPAIKISILGMEYGILFFLEMALLWYGFKQRKTWALILLPILILFTRLDTVIFLGLVFLIDLIWTRKINWFYILGGILGVAVLMSFNWFYFHELANNTITAKQNTYEYAHSLKQWWTFFSGDLGNFWGMIKIPGRFNPFTMVVLLFELCTFIYLVQKKNERNLFLWIIFIFGWVKQVIFLSQQSNFDWYYWVPQLLLFVPVLIFMLEQKRQKWVWWPLFLVVFMLPMLLFQIVHSIATGHGEWEYRRQIGLFLDQHEPDKNQWIFLEPAGFIPYYSHLKTIDYVGLVDKQVQEEIAKDKPNFIFNVVKNRQPKYLLTFDDVFQGKYGLYYQAHYKLLKEYRIEENLESNNACLRKIYHLKPSGSDYNLYERVK